MNLIDRLIVQLRAVIVDNTKTGSQTYTAAGRSFILSQSNIGTILSVTVDGTVLSTSAYTYNENTQEVTINAGSVVNGDAVIISFDYNKYSSTELADYLRSALVYMDVYSYLPHFDISSGDIEIYPMPLKKEQNLIVVIASILIKPDYSEYRTPTINIKYPRTMQKEDRIEQTIKRFKRSVEGVSGILNILGDTF